MQIFHSQTCYRGEPEVCKEILGVVLTYLKEQSDLKEVRTYDILSYNSSNPTNYRIRGMQAPPFFYIPVQTGTKTKH